MTVAGVTATNQFFSPATSLSSKFASNPSDGTLGLAFPALSKFTKDPFFISAISQGSVKAKQFGFFLARQGSELFLGGSDDSKYSGELEFHDIDSSSGFWLISGAKAKVGSAAAVTGFDTIIDSGTTLVVGPPSEVAKLYANVAGSAVMNPPEQGWAFLLSACQNTDLSYAGLYTFPCNSPPEIVFNWGGSDWKISTANINLGHLQSDNKTCVGAIVGQDIGFGANVWALGDSFMKNVYTVFDVDQKAVGFAALS